MSAASVPLVREAYWLAPEAARLAMAAHEAAQGSEGGGVYAPRSAACQVLRRPHELGVVQPDLWPVTCPRAGLWVAASPRAGQVLLLAPAGQRGLIGMAEATPACTIRPSAFRAPAYAGDDLIDALTTELRASGRAPRGWFEPSDKDRKHMLAGAERLGLPLADADRILALGSANHANFLAPRLTAQVDGVPVPYSLAPSAHVCSACLEYFAVITPQESAQWPRLLVAPCSGAAVFARIEPDSFLDVRLA